MSFYFYINLYKLWSLLFSSLSVLDRKWKSNLNIGYDRILSLIKLMFLSPYLNAAWARYLSASIVNSFDLNFVQIWGLKSISQHLAAFHSSNSVLCFLFAIFSSPVWICLSILSFQLSSFTLSQNFLWQAFTYFIYLPTNFDISVKLSLPYFSDALMKLLKSDFSQFLNPD